MQKYKNVLFDLDGTIANIMSFVVDSVYSYTSIIRPSLTKQDIYTMLRDKRLEDVIKEAKLPKFIFILVIFKFRRDLNRQLKNIEVYDGIKEVFEKLHEKDIKVGIVTSNSEINTKQILKANRMHNLVSFIRTKKLFFGKHTLLTKLIEENGLDKEKTVYVGDEVRDIESARKAGISVISVTWGLNKRELLESHHPDQIVDYPSDLLLIL